MMFVVVCDKHLIDGVLMWGPILTDIEQDELFDTVTMLEYEQGWEVTSCPQEMELRI
jgi:hypothetical protein